MILRALVFALSSTLAFSQPSPFEAQIQPYVDSGRFIGSVLVAKEGKVLYRKAFGFAQAEWEIPNTPETKFRIGSITKQFTALAILRLVEQGKLKLDDPIRKHYPAAPATWEAVTIHHLLNHTSGIASYTGQPGFLEKSALTAKPADIIKPIQALPLEFVPGTKFVYNNSGYLLLGLILESLTGQPYAEHLRQTIFEPLGMKDTGADVSSAILKNRAAGYVAVGKELRNAPYTDMTWPFAAGVLYSTVDDLLKWDQALYTDRLLTNSSKEKLFQPGLGNYAYGWSTRRLGTHPVVDHGGGIQGFNTHIARVLDDRITTIVLANMNTPAATQLAIELARLALGMKAKEDFEAITLTPDKLKEYEGVYPLAASFSLTVRSSPMTLQGSGQPRLAVFAYAEDKFFAKAVDAQVEFTRSNGKVDGLILHQNGMDQKAPRQTALIPADRVELPLDNTKSPDYAGTYQLINAPVTLTIVSTDNQLTAQVTGQSALPIYRYGPEEFFYKAVDAQLRFVRNADGKVEAIQFTQGNRESRWARQ